MNAERKQINAFLEQIRLHPGADWHVRQVWNEFDGWKLEWSVTPKQLGIAMLNKTHTIMLTPKAARQVARDLESRFGKAFAAKSQAVRQESNFATVMGWLAQLDAKAKEALHWNRDGIRPPALAAMAAA